MKLQESVSARGAYRVTCLGPASEEDRIRLVGYVAAHPHLSDHPSPFEEAARLLGITLVEKWSDEIDNTVMTEGKNVILDQALAGAAYTVTGPYMGLISSVSYTAIAATDVGTQINGTNGWKEAGGANAPTYTGNRKTCVWSAAAGGSKALSASLSFAITGTGTVKGAFLVFFTNAVATKDDAHGTLVSAGLFGTGDRAVLSGDTLNVSYSLGL
jgi:hypothetical protein